LGAKKWPKLGLTSDTILGKDLKNEAKRKLKAMTAATDHREVIIRLSKLRGG
jgi:hypothetical protein